MNTISQLKRKAQLAFGSAILALLVVAATSYRQLEVYSQSERAVRHTHEVLEQFQDLLVAMQSLESNCRRFIWTGRDSYLASYRASVSGEKQAAARLRVLTFDNHEQQRQLPVLEALAAQKIERAELIIGLRRSHGAVVAAEVLRVQLNEAATDEFSNLLRKLQDEELRLLKLRHAEASQRAWQTKMILIIETFIGLSIALAAAWSVHRDNFGHLRAEEALRNSEENNRMLLDGVQDHAIFMLDPRGAVVSWNAGAERIKGYTADEIIGRNFSCFFSREDIERGRPAEVLKTAVRIGRHEEQSMRVRHDGSQFLANVTYTALRDAAGILRGFSEVSRDLSASQESGAKYRGLLEAAPDAMVVVNQDGDIVLLNAQAEKQFGYRRDELVGQKVTNIIPQGFAERLIADGTRSAAEALVQQIGMGIELSGRRKDGAEFPIEIMLSPLESADGVLVTAAIRDISVRKRAEAHLMQVEGRYRGLLEAAPDGMVVVNQAGEIVLLNVQAEKQFGYRRDELVGQKVTNIIPKGFAERLIADGTRSAAEALAQQIGTGIELSGRRNDGAEFPIEIMLSPLESADGVLVTAAIRDISIRKRAEEHLVQLEGRYRGLLEAAPDAMVVVNQDGDIVLLNVQAEKQFGYRRDELVGQKVTNIIPKGFAERLIADGTRSAAEALAQQIGTGIELSGRRNDGAEFPIEIMLSPLVSAEGVLVTAAIRDISVRKRAEEHLVQLEGRYRGLLEAAPDAMVVVNQDGDIVLLNVQAEKQFGYRRDELVGQKVTNIIPEGFAERLVADALRSSEEALAQQIGAGLELAGQRKDGSKFPIEIMLSPIKNDEGILVTAAIRDITARKKVEAHLQAEAHLLQKMEELKRSNEELGQFAYVASHDLQEPLRMVASYTQLLSRRYKGKLDADADEFIGFAVDGANRMQRLIQDLLAYSRVGTNHDELVPTSSEQALQRGLQNLSGATTASEAIVTHDPLPMVVADETQLIQLFQNLVGNGIKYRTAAAPRVHISAVQNADERWTFAVNDNGLGIEAKYFERIFGMFQRLHKREEFDGTGIGLAICKKIVERHGGQISVESELGHGSTFRFSLAGIGKKS
jgi:PAS domain S-box-containing protein